MARENVAQYAITNLTEADRCCQAAQSEGEAVISGMKALLKQGDRLSVSHAEKLCDRIDSIFFSLMNDINCIAERHDAHYDKTRASVKLAHEVSETA